MAYPLVAELRLVAFLLENEAATDATDMAKRIITALDDERAKHRRFAIIEQVPIDDGCTFHVTGPFSTRRQADTALTNGRFLRFGLDPDPASFRWAYLHNPKAFDQALARADEKPKPPKEKKSNKRGRGR